MPDHTGYWLMNRETGDAWHSCDPPSLIEYVRGGDMESYRLRKLEERMKRLERLLSPTERAEASDE